MSLAPDADYDARMETSAVSIAQRLALEHDVTSVLAAAEAPAVAAAPLIESVCRVLGWQCGAWWLVEPGTEAPACIGVWGLNSPAVETFLRVTRTMTQSRQPGGLIRRAWLEGDPVWLADLTTEPSFRRAGLALEAGLQSAFAFPVRAGSRVIGVMEFFSARMLGPDPGLLESMRHIGSQIGQFCERAAAQQRLRDSEEFFQSTIELAAVGIAHVDASGRFIHANARLCDLLGYTREELLQRTVKDVSHPEDRDVTDTLRQRLRSGEVASFRIEKRYLRKDGGVVWVDIASSVKRAPSGAALYDVTVMIDVTAQKHAAEDLRRFRLAMDKSADIMVLIDRQSMRYLDVNETACRMLGYTREELLRMGPHHVLSASREELERAYDRLIADPASTQVMRGEYRRKDGSVFPFDSTRHVLNSDGNHIIAAISRDISSRIAAEEALRASEARFRSLTDLSSDWYWEQDAELRFTKFEGNGLADAAYRPDEKLRGMRPWELPGVLAESVDWNRHRAMLARREAFRNLEYAYRDRSGREFYVNVSGGPVFAADGTFTGYRGTSRDVTERRRRENELARFQAAMDASPGMIYITDRDSMSFVYVNETACRLSGFTREQFLALGPADILRMERAQIEQMFDAAIAAGDEGTVDEVKSLTKDGTRTMVEVRRRAVRLDGRWLIVTHAHDISGRKRAEQATLRLSRMFAALSATNEAILRAKSREELYQRVCDAAVDGGMLLTTAVLEPDAGAATASIVAVSGGAADTLRQARISVDAATAEGRGLAGTAFQTCAPCVSNDFAIDERTRPWHEVALRAGIASGAAIPLMRDGRAASVLLFYAGDRRAFDADTVRLLERMAENVVFALDNFAREAERRQAEERVRYLASHDSLTGLPNRAMFGQLLGHAIESGRRYKRSFAVLFIDLDRFKMINDTLGHHAGDELLQAIAGRLRKSVRASDVVARLGGDEFVVLIQEVRSAKQVATVARKILSSVIRPLKLAGQEFRVTASIGVSMYPEHAKDATDLMRCADLAMYLAKEEGKNNFQIYSAGIRSASLERMALEANLRRALELGEFAVHYQAKQGLRSGEITGVEALLRWNSALLGPVSPAQFIPVAEETGLIVPIGRWVLQAACAQHVAWLRDGLPPVHMAVNLSPRQFAAPDLLADIDAALARTGMKAEFLELEITEGMVMHNPEQAIGLLRQIKERGIRLAIDDFGTGYSSLAQLKRFPIDTLKVDRSFIRDLPQDVEDKAITEAIIAMARTLSLTVVAEGVETAEQQAFLRDRLCDEMQGYYFSKPLPADECAALLRKVLARRDPVA